MIEYKSLYEYLGRAAGSDLGKAVATAAVAQGVTIQSQEVSNPKYTGTVMVYPVSFLDSYFHPTIELTAKDTEDDSLPF